MTVNGQQQGDGAQEYHKEKLIGNMIDAVRKKKKKEETASKLYSGRKIWVSSLDHDVFSSVTPLILIELLPF